MDLEIKGITNEKHKQVTYSVSSEGLKPRDLVYIFMSDHQN